MKRFIGIFLLLILISLENLIAWSPADTMGVKLISDVQISPNNEQVLYVVTETKTENGKLVSLSSIYKSKLADPQQTIPFSSNEFSSIQPRWSPNGQWVAFVSNRNGINNLYIIPANGGEAKALTHGKQGVQTFAWARDSQKIAFVMTDEILQEKNQNKSYQYNQRNVVNRLWIVEPFSENNEAKSLTPDRYCVRGYGDYGTIETEFDWSPDGKTLVFAHSPSISSDDFNLDSSLAVVNVETGEIVDFAKEALYEAMPRYSPDGKKIAYLTNDKPNRYAYNRQIALRSNEGAYLQSLTPTYNEGPFLTGPNLLGWTKEGNELLFYEPKGTKFHLVFVPVNGDAPRELSTDNLLKDPILSNDKTLLAYTGQNSENPPEVYYSNLEKFEPQQVSFLNQKFLSNPKPKTEVISWVAPDGLEIEGLLTYPLNYEEGKKYPFLLMIHGGPMGFFNESFLGLSHPVVYPVLSFAKAGLAVLRPNPRGSCGYGKSFRCANYSDWGGKDSLDILSGVDSLIDKGIIDKTRMGIMGWSYGGYMAAWIISHHPTKFKAASLGAGVYNLTSFHGTSDLHRFLTDYLGEYHSHRELYQERSPLNYAHQITTPCLIQHGVEDRRVPVSQAYEFYHALERLGKNPILILYPGMGHAITDPKMQIEGMESNLAWFRHHLKD